MNGEGGIMRIGIFDSGIGGLTVLKKIKEHYPNNEYIYYGDTLHLPYGSKTIKELQKLASEDVDFLLSKNVDMIIIACGTVSSNCLDYLRGKYKVPIYDIITPILAYLNNSKYQHIGIIATERTIASHIFKTNLKKPVEEISTPKFVPIIENNADSLLEETIDTYLSPYKNKLDALVLGCTHYPIIKDKLSAYFENRVDILDMSDYLLKNLTDGTSSKITIYFSKLTEQIKENTKRVLELDTVAIYEI